MSHIPKYLTQLGIIVGGVGIAAGAIVDDKIGLAARIAIWALSLGVMFVLLGLIKFFEEDQ